jgi:hypothetical protein
MKYRSAPGKIIWNDIPRNPDFITALKYIFYSPGWSHEGTVTTVKALQEQLKEV